MSEISFRDATAADVATIVAMLADDTLGAGRETVSDPPLPAYLAAFEAIAANPLDHLVVAVVDARVVGCAQLTVLSGMSRRGARRGLIEGVRVSSAVRSGGVGQALIERLIELARAEGCGMVQLTSDMSRTRAHRFYERLGFKGSHLGMKMEL